MSAAVEGLVDEAVVRRLLGHVDAKCIAVYGKEGKQRLLQRLSGYNDAASMLLGSCSSILTATRTVRRRSSRAIWRLHRLACASALRCAQQSRGCLPTGRGAQFLGVAQGRLPGSPERLDDPKREVVALARRCATGASARISFLVPPAAGWKGRCTRPGSSSSSAGCGTQTLALSAARVWPAAWSACLGWPRERTGRCDRLRRHMAENAESSTSSASAALRVRALRLLRHLGAITLGPRRPQG